MNARGREKVWHDLIPVADLEPGDATPVEFRGRELAIFDGTERITVAYARCTHGAANLCDGYFDGSSIECPLHQGLFDATNGAPRAAPARIPLRMIECRVRDGVVQVLL